MLFLSKPFIDELLWEEAVALWAQLTASLRKNTGQREMRNAKPCLQPGSPVPAPSKTSEAVFVAGIMGSKQVRAGEKVLVSTFLRLIHFKVNEIMP